MWVFPALVALIFALVLVLVNNLSVGSITFSLFSCKNNCFSCWALSKSNNSFRTRLPVSVFPFSCSQITSLFLSNFYDLAKVLLFVSLAFQLMIPCENFHLISLTLKTTTHSFQLSKYIIHDSLFASQTGKKSNRPENTTDSEHMACL